MTREPKSVKLLYCWGPGDRNQGGFTVSWSVESFGFGQLAIYHDKDDRICCENEGMSRSFCARVLRELAVSLCSSPEEASEEIETVTLTNFWNSPGRATITQSEFSPGGFTMVISLPGQEIQVLAETHPPTLSLTSPLVIAAFEKLASTMVLME